MKRVCFCLLKASLWRDFLIEYMSDVEVELCEFEDRESLMNLKTPNFDVLFIEGELLEKRVVQKINSIKQVFPQTKIFLLGKYDDSSHGLLRVDGHFEEHVDLNLFSRKISSSWEVDGEVKVLVVDDDENVRNMIADYFADRERPHYVIKFAENGEEGWQAIEKSKPDVLILDIKMPVMDGRDLYKKLHAEKRHVPTIVFFDAISNEEFSEMKTVGNPAIVEKNDVGNSMQSMLGLVKKLAFFSS